MAVPFEIRCEGRKNTETARAQSNNTISSTINGDELIQQAQFEQNKQYHAATNTNEAFIPQRNRTLKAPGPKNPEVTLSPPIHMYGTR
jgi:hypothetical protein